PREAPMTERHGLYDPEFEHDACGIGFVAHIRGEKSRAIVEDALTLLSRLSHRAATGADPDTGDGAGMLLQISPRFFQRERDRLVWGRPGRRPDAGGVLFLPGYAAARQACESILEEVAKEEGQRVLGWGDVPHDPAQLGPVALGVLPAVRQIYIERRRVV